MASSPLVMVVEDQPETLDWLVGIAVEVVPGAEVVAAAGLKAANAWLDRASEDTRLRLGLALVDLVLPDGRGQALIGRLSRELPHVPPVVVTVYDDDANLLDAIAEGAQGYVLKHQDRSSLVRCLSRIRNGEPALTPSIARRILAHFQARLTGRPAAAGGDEVLTPREIEVLGLLARGSRVAEVAARLGLTEQTIATYVKVIYRKLRISSRAEAALEAAKRGLV